MNMMQEYLNEIVNYGGLYVTRAEMIRQLQEAAESTGHPNPRLLVETYLQGHAERARKVQS